MTADNQYEQFHLDFGPEDDRSEEALERDRQDFGRLVKDRTSFSDDQFYPNGAPKLGTPAFLALATARLAEDKESGGSYYNRGG